MNDVTPAPPSHNVVAAPAVKLVRPGLSVDVVVAALGGEPVAAVAAKIKSTPFVPTRTSSPKGAADDAGNHAAGVRLRCGRHDDFAVEELIVGGSIGST